MANTPAMGGTIMRTAVGLLLGLAALTPALAEDMQVELNALENAENRCRMTFVIESKGKAAVDSLKLDLALFNTEGAVYRRMVVDMAPLRANKTIVKAFVTEGECAQLGKVLVNEVTACTPGDAAACQDQLALSSRVKSVRLYK
jgi:hypothetical protein